MLFEDSMVESAVWRDVWRIEVLEAREVERAVRVDSSWFRVVRAVSMAVFWEVRGGRTDWIRVVCWWRVEWRVLDRARRRASFSGLGGIGGDGTLVDADCSSASGASRRSWGGGGGLCCGAGGC